MRTQYTVCPDGRQCINKPKRIATLDWRAVGTLVAFARRDWCKILNVAELFNKKVGVSRILRICTDGTASQRAAGRQPRIPPYFLVSIDLAQIDSEQGIKCVIAGVNDGDVSRNRSHANRPYALQYRKERSKTDTTNPEHLPVSR